MLGHRIIFIVTACCLSVVFAGVIVELRLTKTQLAYCYTHDCTAL